MKILVTGSEGLIGTSLCIALQQAGYTVVRFDLRRSPKEDVRSTEAIRQATADIDGVVHLAAVSRVVWAEEDPERCKQVNVEGLRALIGILCATRNAKRPWLLFASSREVYGQQSDLPVPEAANLRPLNTYARSKVDGEKLALVARSMGIATNVVRLSNVYGSVRDHRTRVIPAFAKAAATGGDIRIDGKDNTFDFVHLRDVTLGMLQLVELSSQNMEIDPIHLCSGTGTTLGELGALATNLSSQHTRTQIAPPRTFDVSRFIGCPKRAKEVLGWQSKIPLRDGLEELIRAFERQSEVDACHPA